MAGIEIRSASDLAMNSDWNLYSYFAVTAKARRPCARRAS